MSFTYATLLAAAKRTKVFQGITNGSGAQPLCQAPLYQCLSESHNRAKIKL